jgi:hypothetical protein
MAFSVADTARATSVGASDGARTRFSAWILTDSNFTGVVLWCCQRSPTTMAFSVVDTALATSIAASHGTRFKILQNKTRID